MPIGGRSTLWWSVNEERRARKQNLSQQPSQFPRCPVLVCMSGFILNVDVPTEETPGSSTGVSSANFVPMSTPRRRLAAALDMEKKICAKLEQQGWTLVIRQGKKIGNEYALVTTYSKFPDVRLAVYQTNNCRIQEVLYCSEVDLALVDQQTAKKHISAELSKYMFDDVGNLIKKPVDIGSRNSSRARQVLSAAEQYTAVLQQTKKLNLQASERQTPAVPLFKDTQMS